MIFRSISPQAGLDAFTAFLRAHLPASALASADLPELYEKYGTDTFYHSKSTPFTRFTKRWRALGYRVDSWVPSYATAIGVSGDTPQALASLAGILVNQGVRYPVVRIEQLHFAQATPFGTF